MSLDPRDGWNLEGAGACLGCSRPTVAAMVLDERRLPVCPECAALAHADRCVEAMMLLRAGAVEAAEHAMAG